MNFTISDIIQLCTLVAVAIPAWIAAIMYKRSFDPNIIVTFKKTAQGLFMITIKNVGSKPAYDVSIKTDKDITNSSGKVLSFNDFSCDSISLEETINLAFDDSPAKFLNSTAIKKFNVEAKYARKPNGKKIKRTFGIDCEKYAKCLYDYPKNIGEVELMKITKLLEKFEKYVCR